MNTWLIILLIVYGVVGLMLAGYVARAGHEHMVARSIQVVVALLFWPIVLPLSIGAVMADRVNEHERAKADFEKRRDEIRERMK